MAAITAMELYKCIRMCLVSQSFSIIGLKVFKTCRPFTVNTGLPSMLAVKIGRPTKSAKVSQSVGPCSAAIKS